MTDDSLPFTVTKDCPECDTEQRIRWPPDNPDSVDIKCHMPECREPMTVERDG